MIVELYKMLQSLVINNNDNRTPRVQTRLDSTSSVSSYHVLIKMS